MLANRAREFRHKLSCLIEEEGCPILRPRDEDSPEGKRWMELDPYSILVTFLGMNTNNLFIKLDYFVV